MGSKQCFLTGVLTFIIGLGVGDFIKWLAFELGRLYWVDALMGATKLGVVGYVVYLGLKQIVEVYREWKMLTGYAENAVEVKFDGIARAYLSFVYLLVAFIMVRMLF